MSRAAALAAGGLLSLAASLLLLFSGAAWLRPYFYLPAWASLLALLAGLGKLGTGSSLLLDDPPAYARRALVSIPFWLAYELLNVRLGNWAYIGLPPAAPLRWAGYALSYATVLPAVLDLSALCRRALGPCAARATPTLGESREVAPLGLACLLLPLLWPRVFFPLVWAPAFLLLEPELERAAPERSWLAKWRLGRRGDAFSLLLGGLLCGVLWEALNYKAGGKWVYTVPWPRGPKLFEMPLLGYAGFAPFALGCASFWGFFDESWRRGRFSKRAAALWLALFSLGVLLAIDAYTWRRAG